MFIVQTIFRVFFGLVAYEYLIPEWASTKEELHGKLIFNFFVFLVVLNIGDLLFEMLSLAIVRHDCVCSSKVLRMLFSKGDFEKKPTSTGLRNPIFVMLLVIHMVVLWKFWGEEYVGYFMFFLLLFGNLFFLYVGDGAVGIYLMVFLFHTSYMKEPFLQVYDEYFIGTVVLIIVDVLLLSLLSTSPYDLNMFQSILLPLYFVNYAFAWFTEDLKSITVALLLILLTFCVNFATTFLKEWIVNKVFLWVLLKMFGKGYRGAVFIRRGGREFPHGEGGHWTVFISILEEGKGTNFITTELTSTAPKQGTKKVDDECKTIEELLSWKNNMQFIGFTECTDENVINDRAEELIKYMEIDGYHKLFGSCQEFSITMASYLTSFYAQISIMKRILMLFPLIVLNLIFIFLNYLVGNLLFAVLVGLLLAIYSKKLKMYHLMLISYDWILARSKKKYENAKRRQ